MLTMMVIGVVLAMLIPAFLNKKDRREWTVALGKAYSILQEGLKQSEAVNGKIRFWSDENFVTNFMQGFKLLDECKDKNCVPDEKYLNGEEFTVPEGMKSFVLADGQVVSLGISNIGCSGIYGNLKEICGQVYIDINGGNRPNTWGKDYFGFFVTRNGLVPFGSPYIDKINDNYEWVENGCIGENKVCREEYDCASAQFDENVCGICGGTFHSEYDPNSRPVISSSSVSGYQCRARCTTTCSTYIPSYSFVSTYHEGHCSRYTYHPATCTGYAIDYYNCSCANYYNAAIYGSSICAYYNCTPVYSCSGYTRAHETCDGYTPAHTSYGYKVTYTCTAYTQSNCSYYSCTGYYWGNCNGYSCPGGYEAIYKTTYSLAPEGTYEATYKTSCNGNLPESKCLSWEYTDIWDCWIDKDTNAPIDDECNDMGTATKNSCDVKEVDALKDCSLDDKGTGCAAWVLVNGEMQYLDGKEISW